LCHRAIAARIGQELRADYQPPQEVPSELAQLVRLIDRDTPNQTN
jgi:hypothetical protein